MSDRTVLKAAVVIGAALVVVVAPLPLRRLAIWALNGRFLATSNGDWAQTNEVYRDEAVGPQYLDHRHDVH